MTIMTNDHHRSSNSGTSRIQANYFDGKNSSAFHEDASHRSYSDSPNNQKKKTDFGSALRHGLDAMAHGMSKGLLAQDEHKDGLCRCEDDVRRSDSPATLRERFDHTKQDSNERLSG